MAERKPHPVESHLLFGWPFSKGEFWGWWPFGLPLSLCADEIVPCIEQYIDHLVTEGREDEIPRTGCARCGKELNPENLDVCGTCDHEIMVRMFANKEEKGEGEGTP